MFIKMKRSREEDKELGADAIFSRHASSNGCNFCQKIEWLILKKG